MSTKREFQVTASHYSWEARRGWESVAGWNWWAEGAATTTLLPPPNFISYSVPCPHPYPYLGAALSTRVRLLATALGWMYDLRKSLSLTVSPFLYLK